MADKPILFSGPMVRALLEGRKSQTRRVLKPQPPAGWRLAGIYAPGLTAVFEHPELGGPEGCVPDETARLPMIGDRLWVREAWLWCDGSESVAYRATDTVAGRSEPRWRPSIHMPRWASRLTLTVTDVRVQRVQEISGDDALAEGIEIPRCGCEVCARSATMCPADASEACMAFAAFWDSLNARRGFGWDANPWVVALTFTVARCNIDQMPEAA